MTSGPDAAYRAWLCEILDAAAEEFGLTLSGPPCFGWRIRSASVPAESADGPRWVRVMTEDVKWAHGEWWTGNTDAT
ncbi:hypothetical protein [Actinomadura atramentaria]|uniref:hypothetical protein n=1 Tax=Actinomadura atramentaria TaxID=1990 RepID=UPI0003654490|nr:hypothetical protein [Actinomadura atramentaria]